MSKEDSMIASRDYVCPRGVFGASLYVFLYASRLVLKHSSASHCRMHVGNGNMQAAGLSVVM